MKISVDHISSFPVIILSLILSLAVSPSVFADDTVTRRDGFLLIWQSIRRPVDWLYADPYTDVPEGERGYEEITYAKQRGILDNTSLFDPDSPLDLDTALLWLYRTRNVAEITKMQWEHLDTLKARYPLTEPPQEVLSFNGLLDLMKQLDTFLAEEVHEVSFYADDFHGAGTAFGEVFDMHTVSAAHRTLPHNTLVKVTNVENGRNIVVRINDRGPYVHGRDMDLSLAAFEKLAPRGQGILHATFARLGDRNLTSSCGRKRFQKRITKNVRFHRGVPHVHALGDPFVLAANKPFVIRQVTYPDGNISKVQDWVIEEEKFSFIPSQEGRYSFIVGTVSGRQREMRMEVRQCL